MFPILDKTKLKLTAGRVTQNGNSYTLKLDVPENVVKGAEIGRLSYEDSNLHTLDIAPNNNEGTIILVPDKDDSNVYIIKYVPDNPGYDFDSKPKPKPIPLSLTLDIRAEDENGNLIGLVFGIKVKLIITNVDELPYFNDTSPMADTVTIDEDEPINTVVATITGDDPDSSDQLFYSFGGTLEEIKEAKSKFSISNNGEIRVLNPDEFDFETEPEFDIKVKLTSYSKTGVSQFVEKTITIKLNNVIEESEEGAKPEIVQYDPNNMKGQIVGKVNFGTDNPDYVVLENGLDSTRFEVGDDANLKVILATIPVETYNLTIIDRSNPDTSTNQQKVTVKLNRIEAEGKVFDLSTLSGEIKLHEADLGADRANDGDTISFIANQLGTGKYGNWHTDSDGSLFYTPNAYLDFESSPSMGDDLQNIKVQDTSGGEITLSGKVNLIGPITLPETMTIREDVRGEETLSGQIATINGYQLEWAGDLDYGQFEVDEATGTWSYRVTQGSIDFLNSGGTRTETITVEYKRPDDLSTLSIDEKSSISQTIKITIDGQADVSAKVDGSSFSSRTDNLTITNDLGYTTGMPEFFGGKGHDIFIGRTNAQQCFRGREGDDIFYGGSLYDLVYGEAGDDLLYGFGGKDTLNGGDGNDLLDGGDGIDTLYGGDDDDTLNGGIGTDTLYGGDGDDLLDGGTGNDFLDGGAGADTLDGGEGNDTASYAGSTMGVKVYLSGHTSLYGDAQGDTLTNIETLIGSSHSDKIYGTSDADVLRGMAGDDLLEGYAGADTLDGGDGNDTATYWASNEAGVTVDLSEEQDSDGYITASYGDAQGDRLKGIENLTGSAFFGDKLTGNAGDNFLDGEAGDDELHGRAGNDTLKGGRGNDTLEGGLGDDIFVLGGIGDGRDIVRDFSTTIGNSDKIRVDTASGNEDNIIDLKSATNIDWKTQNGDTIISRGSQEVMVLEDFTETLTIDMFDII